MSRRFLTTADLMTEYRFPTRHSVRQFLAYHAAEIAVQKRGRVVLVEQAEFDAFLRRERRRQVSRRRAELLRQRRQLTGRDVDPVAEPGDAAGQSVDVHGTNCIDSTSVPHLKPFDAAEVRS